MRLALILAIYIGAVVPARASLTFNVTFDPTVTVAEQATINAGLSQIEANISSPYSLTVNIYYNTMSGGLGESESTFYGVSYQQYYNALQANATSPTQLTALASLGAAPTSSTSGNPVNGNDQVLITSAEARNLGFNVVGGVTVGSNTYDAQVFFNPSITSPPNMLTGNYGLESTIMHETDEVLGIGGAGSTIGEGGSNYPVGDLDLYRYTAPGVRSYSTTQTDNPYSYFSIDGGNTVLSYFNQTNGADYGDWLSNPIPNGYSPQVQDAFATPSTDPSLGVNELTAFESIGYEMLAPEPSTMLLVGSALALGLSVVRRRRHL